MTKAMINSPQPHHLLLLLPHAINSLRSKKHHGLRPVLGMLPSLVIGIRTNTYEWLTDVLNNQNGTFRYKGPWFSSLNCIATSDPRNVEHLLKTKFTFFPKGKFFRDTKLVIYLEMKSIAIDLQDVLLRLTFDNVCMIAFGVDPGCSQPHLPEIEFAKAFEDATEATAIRFVSPVCVWKAMKFLNLGMERKLKKSIEKVDEFAENVIRTRKKELSLQHDEEGNNKEKLDLLTVFMRLKDENGKAYSDKFLRDICVNFILAGRDTSSVALSWFFWLIDQNPEVEEKILAEICRVVSQREGIKKEDFENSLRFRPEEIKKMDYLHAALSEALRLYPSVPVDHKEVTVQI
ncbi:Cytochrome P450 [Sesbania bispinosa]|nr:Cytochrome P450 [Sesbania bispinosa]